MQVSATTITFVVACLAISNGGGLYLLCRFLRQQWPHHSWKGRARLLLWEIVSEK